MLTGLIEKELPIDREIIVVESGSSDGSREIVRSFVARYGLRVIYQDAPRGKGNAVREGLARATGTIVLIQDADFEYDLDDYDALLEPIIQRRASFVLGSRSLGLDDWKVRDYGTSPFKGVLMNLAQVAFARTFNLLYQQKVTDINTMLKVFRRECIAGCHLDCDGFDFDIELVCKIVRNGFEPMEIPINYVARGFDDGKKVRFLIYAYPLVLPALPVPPWKALTCTHPIITGGPNGSMCAPTTCPPSRLGTCSLTSQPRVGCLRSAVEADEC